MRLAKSVVFASVPSLRGSFRGVEAPSQLTRLPAMGQANSAVLGGVLLPI